MTKIKFSRPSTGSSENINPEVPLASHPNKSMNYWMVATFVLGIVLVFSVFSGGITGGAVGVQDKVSAEKAGESLKDFAKSQGTEIEIVSTTEEDSFYNLKIKVSGQEADVKVTKDGAYLATLIPLDAKANPSNPNQQQPQTEVPKADKPTVEMFIMSHCPFGTQIEKGFLPVWKLLRNDMNFEIKFVYYAMHPSAGEVEEQLNQYCIQKEQKDKFYDYLTCFLKDGKGSACLDSVKVDKTKLASCVKKTDETYEVTKNLNDKSKWLSGQFPLFNIHKADNEKYGVGGSPTLVINGVEAQSARDSASLLKLVCSSFNKAPELCKTELSSAQPSPGFGFDTASAQNQAAANAACGY